MNERFNDKSILKETVRAHLDEALEKNCLWPMTTIPNKDPFFKDRLERITKMARLPNAAKTEEIFTRCAIIAMRAETVVKAREQIKNGFFKGKNKASDLDQLIVNGIQREREIEFAVLTAEVMCGIRERKAYEANIVNSSK